LISARWALIGALAAAAISGCSGIAQRPSSSAQAPENPRQPPAPSTSSNQPRGGGYYLDDGPGDNPPPDLDRVPDAVPRIEPLRQATLRPYSAMGREYIPMTSLRPYRERGIASWYGRRYHGQQTSSGETYDMYAMTAAHPTLPIPSYARVTNVATGKSVVVRINDRGPFRSDRLIDLSYTAAYKLGVLGGGKAVVDVESIIPGVTPPAAPVLVASTAPQAPVEAPSAPVNVALIEEPAATPATAPASAQAVAASPGLYLQLGAFATRDNAESFLERMRAALNDTALSVVSSGGLFRVHAGPYASAADARSAATRIGSAFGVNSFIVTH
jgi:rare lipoprotein A